MSPSPQPFGRYLLLERISSGGMAEVVLAKSSGVAGFQRLVALKRILPHLAEDEEFVRMFVDEACIASQLTHQNIVQILELDRHEGLLFMAMEYVAGLDLRRILNDCRTRGEVFGIPTASMVMARVAGALHYAHEKRDPGGRSLGVIHRDVSPQNIILSYEGEVKLCDFGIAKAASRVAHTEVGVLKGKFAYMSPEQIHTGQVDRRSDLFPLGTIFYEALTGHRLFYADNDYATLDAVRSAVIVPPSRLNAAVDSALDAIVMKMLARNPDDRYASAEEVQTDLLRFLDEHGHRTHREGWLRAWMLERYTDRVAQENQRLQQYLENEDASDSEAPFVPVRRATTHADRPAVRKAEERKVARGSKTGSQTAEMLPATNVVDPVEEGDRTILDVIPADVGLTRDPSTGSKQEDSVQTVDGTAPALIGSEGRFEDETVDGLVPDPLIPRIRQQIADTEDTEEKLQTELALLADAATHKAEPMAPFAKGYEVQPRRVSSSLTPVRFDPEGTLEAPGELAGVRALIQAADEKTPGFPSIESDANPPLSETRLKPLPKADMRERSDQAQDPSERTVSAASAGPSPAWNSLPNNKMPWLLWGAVSLAGVVALLLGWLILAIWPNGPLEAAVDVHTIPSGAFQVTVDGVLRASHTPARVAELSAGRHVFEVSREGFQSQTRVVEVNGAGPFSLTLSLEPISQLDEAHRTEPEKIPIEPQGQPSNPPSSATEPSSPEMPKVPSPVVKESVPAPQLTREPETTKPVQKSSSTVEKTRSPAGVRTGHRTADVPAKGASMRDGFLVISTVPPGLSVSIDGVKMPVRTPIQHPLPLAPGTHTLKFELRGGTSYEFQVSITTGETLRFFKRLR